jgi:hypothetical protein
MKKLLTFILLFFCANVSSYQEIYILKNTGDINVSLSEENCPYLMDNSHFNLAIASKDNKKIMGCWTVNSNDVIIIWNINDRPVEQFFKVSDFVFMKII